MLREEVSKTLIISVFFAMLLKNMYENNAFYHRNDGGPSPSTARAHKCVPGTTKTETGTSRENGAEFAPGTETSLEPLKHTLFGEQ